MKLLVTGGAGYIGSVLTARLLQQGFYTQVVDSLLFDGKSLLGLYNNPRFSFIRGDIREVQDLLRVLDDTIDVVIHLAAIVGDPACVRQADIARQVNYEATCKLIDLCKERAVKRFIFISTCSNYGLSDLSRLANEDSPLNPVSLYAETKVNIEHYLLSVADSMFHPCIMRLSTVFGLSPRMRFDLLVNEFTRDAVLNRKLVVYGEQFWRPYVHVSDVAQAIIAVLNAPVKKISREIFNVGANSENYQKRQLVDLILKYIPGTKIEFVERKEDPRDYRVCFDKITQVLHFKPYWTVRDGIVQIKNAIEQGVFSDPFSTTYRNSV